MLSKKSISAPILATCISLNSGTLFAAEESLSSAMPIWPFLAIVGFIFIFRKQLNCVPPLEAQEDPAPVITQEQTNPEPENPTPIITQEPTPVEPIELETPAAEKSTTSTVNENIIDLKDNSGQCQGSTAKGTRCKRQTTLEDSSINIADKTYLLTVCRQHNNKQLKPFAELLK
ncbi:hypothetical protein [Methyloprofundus sp.]|uniref:hypothetical protein n=1 Tax=Methyloprofundus sp. TaxID=2020875 RepID=UPI003D133D0E